MSILVGVISYLPNDLDKRKIRLEEHERQLANIVRVLPSSPIILVQQNYEEEDFLRVEEILRGTQHLGIVEETGIGPAAARNHILKNFYSSEFDNLLMMDDDVWVYPHYQVENVLTEVDLHPEKFKDVAAFCAQHPRYLPFKERVFQDKKNLTHWKFTKKPPNTGMQFSILRNIVLFKESDPVFFNADMTSSFSEGETDFSKFGLEDVDFHLRWIMAGNHFYTLETMQLKEPNQLTSTIFSNDVNKRIAEEKQGVETFIRMHPELSFRQKDGTISWKKVFGFFDKTPPALYVERAEKMECFPENLIPKEKASKTSQVRKKLW